MAAAPGATGTGSSVEVGRGHITINTEFQRGNLDRLRSQLEATMDPRRVGQDIGRILSESIERGMVEPDTSPITDPLEEAGEESGGGFGAKFIAGFAALGVGAALVGGIAESMQQADLSAAFAARTGMDSKAAEKYTASIKNVFKNGWGESVEEVGDIFSQITSSFKGAKNMASEDLEAMASDTLMVSSTFGVDAEAITGALSSMMNSGIISNWEEGMDVLTTGLQTAGVNGADVLDSFTEYSSNFKALGMDAEATMGIMNSMMSTGVANTDFASDSLREMFTLITSGGAEDALNSLGMDPKKVRERFLAGGEEAQSAYNDVVNALNKADDSTKREAMVGIFGTVGGEDFYNAFKQGIPTVKMEKHMAGATDKMAETLDTPIARIESFKRTFTQGFVDVIGNTVLPLIEKVTGVLTTKVLPAVKPIGDALGGGLDFLRKYQDVILPIGAAVAGLATPILVVSGAMKLWAAATTVMTVAQTALNLVMNANPIMRVVTILFAAGAAIYALWKTNETFRNGVIGSWEAIRGAFGATGEWIANTFTNVVNGFKGFMADSGRNLTDFGNSTAEAFGNMMNGIGGFFSGVGSWLSDFGVRSSEWFTGLIAKIGGFLGSVGESLIGFGTRVGNWFHSIFDRFATFSTRVGEGMMLFRDRILNWFTGMQDGVKAFFGDAVDWYMGRVRSVIDFFMGAKDKVAGAYKAIAETVGGVFDKLKDTMLASINFVIDGLNGAIKNINGIKIAAPDWVPVLGGKSWGPNIDPIPNFASGGTIKARPGGTIIRVAEAGRAETVVDADLYKERMKELKDLRNTDTTSGSRGDYSPTIIVPGAEVSGDELTRKIYRHHRIRK